MKFLGKAWSTLWSGLWLLIDQIIYNLISRFYRVFTVVSTASIFDGSNDVLQAMVKRVYTILGVVMLFVLAYNVITMIMDPNKMDSKDEKSFEGIAKNVVISIILFTLITPAFNYLNILQKDIIESNVIGNVILGAKSDTSDADSEDSTKLDLKQGGVMTAISIYSAFFHPVTTNADGEEDAFTVSECGNSGLSKVEKDYCDGYDEAIRTGNIKKFMNIKDISNAIWNDEFSYSPLISTIAGVVALYMILTFTLDVGVRAAKLAFYQIVAPIPIALRITKPKGGTFDKWLKDLISCYLGLFIRLIAIYFCVFTIGLIAPGGSGGLKLWQSGEGTGVGLIATVIVILGILKFAKDAPKMIEELFDAKKWDLDFGKGSIKKKLNDNEYAKRAVSAAGTIGGNLARGSHNLLKGKNGKFNGGELLNIPARVIGGASKGWKNGNFDLSKGFKEGGKELLNNINASSEHTNRRINRLNQLREKGSELTGGKYIPGITRIFGNGQEVRDNFKESFSKENIASWLKGDNATTSSSKQGANGIVSQLENLMKAFKTGNIERLEKVKDKKTEEFLSKNPGATKKQIDAAIAEYTTAIRKGYAEQFNANKSTIQEIFKSNKDSIISNYEKLSKESQIKIDTDIGMDFSLFVSKAAKGEIQYDEDTISNIFKVMGDGKQIIKNIDAKNTADSIKNQGKKESDKK